MVAYSFKGRFVEPIRYGLGQPINEKSFVARAKRQTIRAIGKRRHARPGETLQLYYGMRTARCVKIGDARCTETFPISIEVGEKMLMVRVNGELMGFGAAHEFSLDDGFDSPEDMLAFWQEEHGRGEFNGLLIKWEPMSLGNQLISAARQQDA